MGLRINTNVASLAAQRQISRSNAKLENTMKQLASGNRFADPLESSAELGISEHLRGQSAALRASTRNADNAISFVQVAEGGLNEQSNILIRMRELAIQSASDTFGDRERDLLSMEFEELKREFDRIAQSTSYGRQKLLNGDEKTYEFQVGPYKSEENRITYRSSTNTTADKLGIDGVQVSDQADARDSLETIDNALYEIAQARATLGATQSRLESVVNHTSEQANLIEEARSKLADTDVARSVSQMYQQQALQQYQLAVLANANQYPGSIFKLIA